MLVLFPFAIDLYSYFWGMKWPFRAKFGLKMAESEVPSQRQSIKMSALSLLWNRNRSIDYLPLGGIFSP